MTVLVPFASALSDPEPIAAQAKSHHPLPLKWVSEWNYEPSMAKAKTGSAESEITLGYQYGLVGPPETPSTIFKKNKTRHFRQRAPKRTQPRQPHGGN